MAVFGIGVGDLKAVLQTPLIVGNATTGNPLDAFLLVSIVKAVDHVRNVNFRKLTGLVIVTGLKTNQVDSLDWFCGLNLLVMLNVVVR